MKKRLVALALTVTLTAGFAPACLADEAPAKDPDGGAVAAAVVSDIVYIPGKTLVCISSGVLWAVAMTISFGTLYKESGNLVHSACTGKWVLTGHDMMD